MLKVKYIQVPTERSSQIIKRVEEQLVEADKNIGYLRRNLNVSLIKRAGDELGQYGELVNTVAASTVDMREAIGPILFADHELSDDEEQALQAFRDRDDVDLADLFVHLRQTGHEIELNDLMDILEQLYRKNRAMIRVKKRG